MSRHLSDRKYRIFLSNSQNLRPKKPLSYKDRRFLQKSNTLKGLKGQILQQQKVLNKKITGDLKKKFIKTVTGCTQGHFPVFKSSSVEKGRFVMFIQSIKRKLEKITIKNKGLKGGANLGFAAPNLSKTPPVSFSGFPFFNPSPKPSIKFLYDHESLKSRLIPQIVKNRKPISRKSSFLHEKKKILYFYGGLAPKDLNLIGKKARHCSGFFEENMYILLESRVDVCIYRAGKANTIAAARQLIRKGHVLLNMKKLSSCKSRAKPGDYFSFPFRSSIVSPYNYTTLLLYNSYAEKTFGSFWEKPFREKVWAKFAINTKRPVKGQKIKDRKGGSRAKKEEKVLSPLFNSKWDQSPFLFSGKQRVDKQSFMIGITKSHGKVTIEQNQSRVDHKVLTARVKPSGFRQNPSAFLKFLESSFHPFYQHFFFYKLYKKKPFWKGNGKGFYNGKLLREKSSPNMYNKTPNQQKLLRAGGNNSLSNNKQGYTALEEAQKGMLWEKGDRAKVSFYKSNNTKTAFSPILLNLYTFFLLKKTLSVKRKKTVKAPRASSTVFATPNLFMKSIQKKYLWRKGLEKPLHLEISHKTGAFIYMYPPQKITSPVFLDFKLKHTR